MNPLRSLHDNGQAVWLDFVARRFIAEGGLKKLIENTRDLHPLRSSDS
jgi:hypothetical protein